MAGNGLKPSTETLSSKTVEETFKVSELSEKFEIAVSREELNKYGEIFLNLTQINRLKEGKTSIEKLYLEDLKKSIDDNKSINNTKEAINKFKSNFKDKEALEEKDGSLEKLSSQMYDAYEELGIQNTSSDVQQTINKGIEKVKEASVGVTILNFVEKLKNSDNPVFSFLGSILGFFTDMFGFKKDTEDLKDKIDPNSPEFKETLNKSQDVVISYIEKATGEQLTEKQKDRIKNKMNPNSKGSYIDAESFKAISEKIKNGEKISIDDFKEGGIILKLLNDPDFKDIKEKLSQNINKQVFNFLKKKFEIAGVSFDTSKETKLKGIIKREFENTTLNQLVDRTKENNGNVHFDGFEGIKSIFGVGILIPNIILEAYKEDIIKAQNLAVGVVESGKETLSIGLKALDGQDIIPDLVGRMSWDDFDEKLQNISPEKKLLLERAFYAEMGLVAGVLGTIGFYGTSGLVSIIESGKNVFSGKVGMPPVERLQKTLDIIEPGKGTWLKDIKIALSSTQESYKIVEELKNPNLDKATKEALRDKLSKINKNFDSINAKLYSSDTLSKITKNMNPLQSYHFKNSIEELGKIARTNEKLGVAILEGSFTKKALEAKQFIEKFKIRYVGGHAILNITDDLKGKEFAKAMGSLSPEIVKGLFRVMPIAILGSTIYDTAKNQEGDWFDALYNLNGFVGGIQLFKDTEVSYTEEGLNIKNPESFAGGIALVGMETFFVFKDLAKYTNGQVNRIPYAVLRAGINSFARIPIEAIKAGSWGIAKSAEIFKMSKAFLRGNMKKGGVIKTLLAGTVLGGVAYAEGLIYEDNESEELEKQGFLKQGEPNIDLIKKKWPNLESETKEDILRFSTIGMLPFQLSKSEDKINSYLNNNTFNIEVDPNILQSNKTAFEDIERGISEFLYEINSDIKVNLKKAA